MKRAAIFSPILLYLSGICGQVEASVYTDNKDRLYQTLLSNYKKDVHPSSKERWGQIHVQLGYIPIYLDIDEQKGIVSVHGWFGMAWQDDRLKWSPSDYTNVTQISVGPEKLWKPDLRVYNSMKHEDYEDTDVVVGPTGHCWWIPPLSTYTYCTLDFTYWPWDIQHCVITIGSWTKEGWELDVFNFGKQNQTTVPIGNYKQDKWQLISGYNVREMWEQTEYNQKWYYPYIDQHLYLKRTSGIDRKLAILPLLVISCLTLATFWTYPTARSRIILGAVNFLVCAIFLLFLRTRMPLEGAQLPMIVSFSGSVTVLVMIQIICALAVTNLVARSDQPPSWIISPLEGIMGKILCLSNVPLFGQIPPGMPGYSIDVEAMRNDVTSNSTTSAGDPATCTDAAANPIDKRKLVSSDWNLLSQAIDRILFVLYTFIILIFLATYVGGAANTTANNPNIYE